MWTETPARAKPHTTSELPQLVVDLLRPEAYPERTSHVELRETHISWVFLTDRHAYKVKKPVRFSFLDFSTIDNRKRACADEVRLNRRLAPTVYLGVVPVRQSPEGRLHVGAGPGEVVDYAVVMRRLPDELLMDRMLADGRLTREHIRELAERLAEFYRGARRDAGLHRYATAEAVRANVTDNLEHLMRWPDLFGCPLLRRLMSAQLQFVALEEQRFSHRIEQGCVCDGHGDLRPEHVCFQRPVAVFDCVEFSEALRANDVLSDVAFLAMELDAAGRTDLANLLLEELAKHDRRFKDRELLAFYKAYRALVRAKVLLLRAGQETDEERRQRDWDLARHYAELAAGYDNLYHTPLLIAMCGPAGSGKTTLAYEIARRIGAAVVRTDEIRQRLTGKRAPDAPYGAGIYHPSVTRRVYDAMFEEALERVLEHRTSVILDATFSSYGARARLRDLARRARVPYVFVYCQVDPAEAARRVEKRRAEGADISDARADIVRRHAVLFALARDLARSDVIAVPMDAPVEKAGDQVLQSLRSLVARARRPAQ